MTWQYHLPFGAVALWQGDGNLADVIDGRDLVEVGGSATVRYTDILTGLRGVASDIDDPNVASQEIALEYPVTGSPLAIAGDLTLGMIVLPSLDPAFNPDPLFVVGHGNPGGAAADNWLYRVRITNPARFPAWWST